MGTGWIPNGGNQERNPPIFDHCNLQVWMNHSRYPSADMGVYKSSYDFTSRYYGIDNLLAGSQVNPAAYKAFYQIHVFDGCIKTDLTVKMEFSENIPADTQAYALVISDRMLKFKSGGSKMSVLF